jgi:hypothetical protein
MTERFENKVNGLKEQAVDDLDHDLELGQALNNFRSSIHAWSDAAYSRPRTLATEVRHRSWRLALGWAMGCLLVAGSVSGGVYEHRLHQEQARVEAQHRAEEQAKLIREQQATKVSDEALLADVDSDVSRQVPSAMEPLAQMMSEDETK